MRAAIVTRQSLVVVADAAAIAEHCRAKELLWALENVAAKDRTVYQSVRVGRARKLIRRGLA